MMVERLKHEGTSHSSSDNKDATRASIWLPWRCYAVSRAFRVIKRMLIGHLSGCQGVAMQFLMHSE